MNRKVIQEAGTPALLCFKPEERPAGCRITSLIKRIVVGNSDYYINFT